MGIVCSLPEDGGLPGSIATVDKNGNITWSGNPENIPSTELTGDPHTMELYPPSGTIPYNTQAYVNGIANYFELPGGLETKVAVPSDKCDASQINGGGAYIHVVLAVLCHAWVQGPVVSSTSGRILIQGPPPPEYAFGTINQP